MAEFLDNYRREKRIVWPGTTSAKVDEPDFWSWTLGKQEKPLEGIFADFIREQEERGEVIPYDILESWWGWRSED